MIQDILMWLCLGGAVGLLGLLSAIDLRTFLLPNRYVLAFAILGIFFHLIGDFRFVSPLDMAAGAGVGFGFLYLLRLAANAIYKEDALGLGDVKLMGAGGLWLGVEGVLLAITAGAFAGLLIGLLYAVIMARKNGHPLSLRRLAVPAGPGFATGLVLVGGWLFFG